MYSYECKTEPHQPRNTGHVKVCGLIHDIMAAAADVFNFTYQVEVQEAYGRWDKMKHEWSGVMGSINRSEADLGPAFMTVTYSRTQGITFLTPFETGSLGISVPFTHHDVASKDVDWLSMIDDWTTMCLGVVSLSSILLLFLRHQIHQPSEFHGHDFMDLILRGLSVTVLPLIEQSPQFETRKVSRIGLLVGIWWFLCINLSNYFTSQLTAIMSVPPQPNRIDSLWNLVNQNELGWGILTNSIHHDLFNDVSDSRLDR